MNQTNRYIYVRNHPSYDVDDVCKMGKAKFLKGIHNMLLVSLREKIIFKIMKIMH